MHLTIGRLVMNKKSKFKDKVVIITGASSGIGRTTALEFARVREPFQLYTDTTFSESTKLAIYMCKSHAKVS